MSLALRLSGLAERDLREAGAWYEQLQVGLGEDFVWSVEDSFARIANHPESYPILYREIRKATVRRFPYAVLYRVRKNVIHVTAILHTSRSPDVWRSRY